MSNRYEHEVWKAYRVMVKGYYVGVIFGTGTGDAELRAWDWFGCSKYDDRVEVHFIRNVNRSVCLRPWLMKGERRVYS